MDLVASNINVLIFLERKTDEFFQFHNSWLMVPCHADGNEHERGNLVF